jgi:hypothetical protein
MRIAAHHRRRLPAPKLLKNMQRCPVLHVPRGPGMAQIVKAKRLDTGALERLVPRSRTDLLHRVAVVGEHTHRVLPLLPGDDLDCRLVERHRDRPPRLRLIRVNPSLLARQIDLLPSQTCYVRSPETRSQSKGHHVLQCSGNSRSSARAWSWVRNRIRRVGSLRSLARTRR